MISPSPHRGRSVRAVTVKTVEVPIRRWVVQVTREDGDILEYEYLHEAQARFSAAVFSLGPRWAPRPIRRLRPAAWLAQVSDGAQAVSASRAAVRTSPRYQVVLEVRFGSEQEFVLEHATNISRGGMFIATRLRPDIGAPVSLEVKLPNGVKLSGKAEVVYARLPPGAGVGVQFLEDDPAFKAALDDYLATLR